MRRELGAVPLSLLPPAGAAVVTVAAVAAAWVLSSRRPSA